MRGNLRGVIWRLTLAWGICLALVFGLIAVFGDLRFQQQQSFNAEFTNVSGLKGGDFVRIAGVEVGKVTSIAVNDDATVRVQFSTDTSVVLTDGTRAVVRYENLVGDRYLALEQGPGSVRRLYPSQTIPISRTQPGLDVDAVIGGLHPLLRALDPNQVNALTGQLIQIFQGQGELIGSFLDQTAALTGTLADRDHLIGEVITNLNTVLGSLGDQSTQLDHGVDSLSELTKGLAERRTDLANGIAHIDAASAAITNLLSQARAPLKNTVHQLDRTAGIIAADHGYMDNLLQTLPDKYQLLQRQGLHGDFFSFYLCDLFLKLNGKGGQPVYVKMAGQSTGRCTPK
jgi:phospholipid/cholesterol/gamma-HCH transport system substrate-binding protein